jgi:putative membrane protein
MSKQGQSFLTRTVIAGLGLLAAISIVPGLRYTGGTVQFIILALIFGLVNAVIRPILAVLSCPLVLLTLGLFILVINAIMLLITQGLAQTIGIQFTVADFGAALVGAIVISIISIIATMVFRD